MLVLTRKTGESINIGDDIKLSIIGIKGKSVKIGIDAPISTAIHRQEIYEKMKEQNRNASGFKETDMEKLGKLIKKLGR
ncbi:MAG: hypothetical protein IEMM0002_0981 [bacterium]|nr:MAG: hypothetical protein IEMM0002_0981 [bacterium]